MNARDMMTRDPMYCTPDTPIQTVAQLMREHDCGEIPVVDTDGGRRPVGVVTDRDITCRLVAAGEDPQAHVAADVMTTPAISVLSTTSLDECCQALEENQVRRLPVVDERGVLCGIVAQADLARQAEHRIAEVIRDVSRPASTASRVRL